MENRKKSNDTLNKAILYLLYIGISSAVIGMFAIFIGLIIKETQIKGKISKIDTVCLMIYFVILIAYIETFLGYSFMKKVDEDKFFSLIKILLTTTCAAVILLKDIAIFLIPVSLFFLLGAFLNQKKFERYIIKLKSISVILSQIIFFPFIAFATSMIVGIPLATLLSIVSKNEKITLELMKVIYVTTEIIFGIYVGMKLSKKEKISVIIQNLILFLLIVLPYILRLKILSLFFSKIFTIPITIHTLMLINPDADLKGMTVIWISMQISFLGGILLSNIAKFVFKKIYR